MLPSFLAIEMFWAALHTIVFFFCGFATHTEEEDDDEKARSDYGHYLSEGKREGLYTLDETLSPKYTCVKKENTRRHIV